jgi:hypothetical protein
VKLLVEEFRSQNPESRIQKEAPARSQQEFRRQYSGENGTKVRSLKTFASL